jgi:F-type H+-transporting ATPase subunit delta
MASYDHNSTAIADSYAKTLFELTEQAGTVDVVLNQFRDFVAYMQRDADFAGFMTSHAVDSDRRAEVLEKHFRGKLDDLLLSTLQVINRKGRGELVPLICDRFETVVETARNEVEVDVTSAVSLSDAARINLRETVGRVFGKTAKLVEHVDPAILGGLIVRVGDEKLDSSVVKRIAGLSNRLHERAIHEIHDGQAYTDTTAGA